MWFNLNKKSKNLDFKQASTIYYDAWETIEIILNEFTSEQLKFLEVQDPDNKGITTFKEAMIAFYGEMLPKFKKQETRERVKEIIHYHKDKFNSEPNYKLSSLFINKFLILFEENN